MSIRPVDLQVLLPRSAEVSRIANNENGRPEAQQQQFAQALQKQAAHEQRQVVQAAKSDKQPIDKDGPNRGKQQKKDKPKPKSGEMMDEDVRAQKNAVYENKGIVDISV